MHNPGALIDSTMQERKWFESKQVLSFNNLLRHFAILSVMTGIRIFIWRKWPSKACTEETGTTNIGAAAKQSFCSYRPSSTVAVWVKVASGCLKCSVQSLLIFVAPGTMAAKIAHFEALQRLPSISEETQEWVTSKKEKLHLSGAVCSDDCLKSNYLNKEVAEIVASLYMEEVESRALSSITGTVPSHWFRYVHDTWVKIYTKELETSTHHNNTNDYVKFTKEDVKEDSLAFLDCAVKIEEDRNLSIEVYRRPTHREISNSHLS